MRLKSFRTSAALILTTLMLVVVAATAATAQTFATLHSFDGPHGANPIGGPLQATNGNLYGTTYYGGANGAGTVFKFTPSGKLTTLHSFNSTDGSNPQGALVQATNGNFYGTTNAGGANGQGTVFKITQSGTLTTLYSFCSQSNCTDGAGPTAGLILATDGNFYGTTWLHGGANGQGTVFKITPSGTLATLYSFCSRTGCRDGIGPFGGIVQASNGKLYGTTAYSGPNYCPYLGCGTVFRITLSGTLRTLHAFDGTDGDSPWGPLLQASDGNIYGTTFYEGANGYGTVFNMTLSGTLTVLHSFNFTDGFGPSFALVQATDGNFYGTTQLGGANDSCDDGCGTVFKLTPTGTLTTLYNFCSQSGCVDGFSPVGLAQATDGNFYGITYGGGTNGLGTVFSLSVGLGPFVETQPTSGKLGRPVKVLGTNLTGATSVSFNGVAATFTVLSSSLIKTTVPASASTGFVTVTAPSGTLTSNKQFTVEP